MDINQQINDLRSRFDLIKKSFSVDDQKKELRLLEAQSNIPDFWQKDIQKAKNTMKKIASISKEIKTFKELEKDIDEIKEIVSLAKKDSKMEQNIKTEINKLTKKVEKFETKMFLSGQYDENEAILSIHAGQGGTEAMDWVAMCSRMYQ